MTGVQFKDLPDQAHVQWRSNGLTVQVARCHRHLWAPPSC